MVHFVRDKHNNTIAEISAYDGDVKSSVRLHAFAERLLAITTEDPTEFIEDIEFLNEIRCYWFERNDYDKKFKTVDEMSTYFCKKVANKWNLGYVTD